MIRLALTLVALAFVSNCSGISDDFVELNQSSVTATATGLSDARPGAYQLGAGDRIRVIVFGESELSGEFLVDDGGRVDLPLIGDVAAGGNTLAEFESEVISAFKNGYLKDPKISVEVLNYRPYFIVGEVESGGEFSYKGGMTVQDAVSIAGGYTYRANIRTAFIRKAGQDKEIRVNLAQRVPISPGDNIRIPERLF